MKNRQRTIIRGRIWLLVALISLPAAGCSPDSPPFDSPLRPSIILVVNDALRADRLGCYGYHRPTSPNIDIFAGESVLFERALSNSPWSAPSFTSLFSSLSPEVHGVSNLVARINIMPPLPGRVPLLAEVLRERGYLTIGLYGGGNIPGERGFARGFDSYEPMFHDWQMNAGASPESLEQVIESIRGWMEKSRSQGRPLFLFLHHLICHDPYLYGPEDYRLRFLEEPVPGWPLTIEDLKIRGPDINENFWRGVDLKDPRHRSHINALYDGGVLYSDYVFGILLDCLKEEEIYEDSLIILTSDHGEALGEHGTKLHGALWREHLHVPLIIRFPGRQFGGRRVEPPVGLMDLAPTTYDYLEIPLSDPVQGRSLTPLLARPGEGLDSPVASYSAAGNNPFFHLGAIRITGEEYVYIRGVHQSGSLLGYYLDQRRDGGNDTALSFESGESGIEELISRGDFHFQRDMFGEARKFYHQAMELAPDNVPVRLRLAAALREEQLYLEAEELVRDLILRAPESSEAYRELAWIACDQMKFEEGGELFSRAAEQFPEVPRVYLDWAHCLRRQARREEAEEKIQTALRVAGDGFRLRKEIYDFYLWLGKPEQAAAALQGQLEANHSDPEYVAFMGNRFLEGGKIREGVELYEKTARENPGQVWPYLVWADFVSNLREYARVGELIEESLVISPGEAWLLRAAGEKYIELGKPERAVELLTAAVDLEPERNLNRLLLGTAYRLAGYLEAAEAVLEEAGALLGEDGGLNLEIGKVYLSQGREDEAEEVFRRADAGWMGHHALYDIRNDPGETRNIFLERPREAGRMLELERKIREEDRTLRRYYREGEKARPTSLPLDGEREREIREQLKLLGY